MWAIHRQEGRMFCQVSCIGVGRGSFVVWRRVNGAILIGMKANTTPTDIKCSE